MNKVIKTLIWIAVIGILVAVVVVKLLTNQEEVEARVYSPEENVEVFVQVDTIKTTSFSQSLSFTGSFEPYKEVIIGAETSGKVVTSNIEEGTYVQKGQLIAKLDEGILQAQLKSAHVNLDRTSNVLETYKKATSGVTQLQIDNANSDFLSAKAQINQLSEQLKQLTIIAPFSGIITSKNFELGSIVSPGMQMATLTDISLLKLDVNVPEKDISKFQKDQKIAVITDVFPGTQFKGNVIYIASKADASHNFNIKILVPNDNLQLKSGMYGTILLNNMILDDAITIPRSALIGSSLNPKIYVVENGIAKLRNIQISEGNDTHIVVSNGLHSGEIIISGGLVNVNDGTKVKVAN